MGALDPYVLRARLFPAILGVAPVVAFALAWMATSWEKIGLPQVLVSAAVGVLFFAFSDLARQFGKKTEAKLFSSTGGRPFPKVLRHRDTSIDEKLKARYHKLLENHLQERAPSANAEAKDPQKADGFYDRCGIWLRERTRDQSQYKLVFEENVTYGFRRNLYGMKWVGLSLNFMVVAACCILLWMHGQAVLAQYGTVLVVTTLHALYFVLAVTKKSVLAASDHYGRQLVLALESLKEDKANAQAAAGD